MRLAIGSAIDLHAPGDTTSVSHMQAHSTSQQQRTSRKNRRPRPGTGLPYRTGTGIPGFGYLVRKKTRFGGVRRGDRYCPRLVPRPPLFGAGLRNSPQGYKIAGL
jgi:hypothetical protein